MKRVIELMKQIEVKAREIDQLFDRITDSHYIEECFIETLMNVGSDIGMLLIHIEDFFEIVGTKGYGKLIKNKKGG